MECIVSFLDDIIIPITDDLFKFTHRRTIHRIKNEETFVLSTCDRDVEFVVDLLEFLVSDRTTLEHIVRQITSRNKDCLLTAIETVTDTHVVILTNQLTLSRRRVNIKLVTNSSVNRLRNITSCTSKRIDRRHIHETLTDTLKVVDTDVFVLHRTIRELSEDVVGNICHHKINTRLNILQFLLNSG